MSSARRAALAALLILLVAACGGTTSSASPGGASAPVGSAPAATEPAASAPASSEEPSTEPASASTGGADIGGAAAALDDLSSYKFALRIAAEGDATFMTVASGGSMGIEGTVILKPEQAVDFTMTTTDAQGTSTAIGYRLIGDTAFVSLGSDQWLSVPADDAEKTVDSFRPESLMSGFGDLGDLAAVGDEDKNGVTTTHYQGQAPGSFGSMFALPDASWTVDVWVAKDGGYLVSQSIVGEATNGKFTMSIDVSDFDSPDNKVEAPANAGGLGG